MPGQRGRFSCMLQVDPAGQIGGARCERIIGTINPQLVEGALRRSTLFGQAASLHQKRLEIEL